MAAVPRELFADDAEPPTLLADFALVAERMARDVAEGRRTATDAAYVLAISWALVTRLLPHDTVPSSRDLPAILATLPYPFSW